MPSLKVEANLSRKDQFIILKLRAMTKSLENYDSSVTGVVLPLQVALIARADDVIDRGYFAGSKLKTASAGRWVGSL